MAQIDPKQTRYLKKLRQQVALRDGLPFWLDEEEMRVNAHKLYKWQMEFFRSTNRITLLTAANQIGKSSIQIIKALNLGFREQFWPTYFKRTPQMFLYYMPDQKTFDVEFQEKWVKTYLPKDKFADHQVYGWKAQYDKPQKKEGVTSLELATGVTIFFRTYSQLPQRTQAVTADLVLLDEECPRSHWDELMVRTQTFGLVSMVFTATLGSEYLFRAMMLQGSSRELFPTAKKMMISMYQCINYADGTPSGLFTKDRIENEIIPTFSSNAEVRKRVYGEFVKTSGQVYQEFDESVNTCPDKINADWMWVAGIDWGAGGKTGHPCSICFVQVSPCYSKARVIKTFHSGSQRFTQGDLIAMYKRLAEGLDVQPYFDWSATDLGEIAAREGIPMLRAEKSHEIGIPLVNALFKNRQLEICIGDDSLQNAQLIEELRSVSESTQKKHRKDDASDAMRYALSSLPFRFTPLPGEKKEVVEEITNPRIRFHKGIDRPGDPMRMQEEDDEYYTDGNFDRDFEEAYQAFEEIL